MNEQRLIDAVALEKDLRKQFKDVFGKAEKKVKPEDYFIERRSAFHAAFIEAELEGFIEYLERRPTVDSVKHGKWIKISDLCGVEVLKCSACSKERPRMPTMYCCDYGAKMDGE